MGTPYLPLATASVEEEFRLSTKHKLVEAPGPCFESESEVAPSLRVEEAISALACALCLGTGSLHLQRDSAQYRTVSVDCIWCIVGHC